MKNIAIIALFACMGLQVKAQDHQIFGKKISFIEKEAEVELFEIDKYRVAAENQDSKNVYINDYKILKKIELSKKDKKHLTDEATDADNYDQTKIKSCPFIANYAVVFKQGTQSVTVIVSEKSCKKVMIFQDREIFRSLDLTEKNSLETRISRIL